MTEIAALRDPAVSQNYIFEVGSRALKCLASNGGPFE